MVEDINTPTGGGEERPLRKAEEVPDNWKSVKIQYGLINIQR